MEKEQEKQERKSRAKNGERTQKMMSFRCDDEVAGILAKVSNKGRLLNDLVKVWARQQPTAEPQDYPPEENEIDDYMP